MKEKNKKHRRVRGTAVFDEESNGFSFTAYNEAPSTQRNVRTYQGSKLYETTGENAPKRVAYLTCNADSADPYADLLEKLNVLTKDIRHGEPTTPPDRQWLMNESGVQAWLNTSRGELTYTGTIRLAEVSNWQAELLRLSQLLVRTLPVESRFIKALKKFNSLKNN